MRRFSSFVYLAFILSFNAYANDFGGRYKGLACFDGARQIHSSYDARAGSTPFGEMGLALDVREDGKTGLRKYDFGNDRICVLRDAGVNLVCTVGEKVIFRSTYSDIHRFEPENRGFVLQSHKRESGVSVYTFSPGDVVCTSS